jgi:ATP-dependent Clp protease ATP-binding subunit ClpA
VDRFDRFTDEARSALIYAQDEAQRFNHNYIGTEHLLLGLLRVTGGQAPAALESQRVDLSKVRTAVEFIIGRGGRPILGEVGLTPRAKRVIELAIEEARAAEAGAITDGHLLLGVVREGDGIAAGVLESLGVQLDRLRRDVATSVSGPSAGPPKDFSGRRRVPARSRFEERLGASRAVTAGRRVLVSAVPPVLDDGSCPPDAASQARRCLEVIARSLIDAGATTDDVVRTRVYITEREDVEAVAAAHAAVFSAARPASTLVLVAGFADERWRVQIEAEAELR